MIRGRTSRAALVGTLSLRVPAGVSRNPLTTSSADSTSASAGPRRPAGGPGLCRHDAARRPVEKAYAELVSAGVLLRSARKRCCRWRAPRRGIRRRAPPPRKRSNHPDPPSLFDYSRTARPDCGPVIAQAYSAYSGSKRRHAMSDIEQGRNVHARRPRRQPARIRRDAARRARRVRAAEGPRSGASPCCAKRWPAASNHIDTSDFYGPHVTNQIIRKALHPYPR